MPRMNVSAISVFEQPLNERMRSFLRLEYLFQRLDFQTTAVDDRYGPTQRGVIRLVRIDAHEMKHRAQQILNAVRLRGGITGGCVAGSDHRAAFHADMNRTIVTFFRENLSD